MPEVAYFDPADLMVWFDQGVLFNRFDRRSAPGGLVPPHVQDATFGIIRGAFDTRTGLNDDVLRIVEEFGVAAVMSLAALWHEQRHFVDHLLTNFGASRIRLFLQIRTQLENILAMAQDDGVLAVPLDIYADPVECTSLGLTGGLVSALTGIGAVLADRRQMVDTDKRYGRTPVTAIPVDGFCQLEALGSLAQLSGLSAFLRHSVAKDFRLFETPFNRFPYLEAIVSVMHGFGIQIAESFGEKEESFGLVNPHLISMVLVASLMCRRIPPTEGNDGSNRLPALRLGRILTQLHADGVRTADSGVEALEIVDRACRKIWHQSLSDDLDQDLAFEKSQFARFQGVASESEMQFLGDYHAARTEMRAAFLADPGRFSDSWKYATETIPMVRPKIVLANRAGTSLVLGEGEPESFRILYADTLGSLGGNRGRMRACYYSDVRGAEECVVGNVLFADKYWTEGFWKSRFIRLLTKARRQSAGAEIDAFIAERELESLGIELRFRHGDEYPEVQRSAETTFDLLGTDRLKCEITGREVTVETAILLCPWDFVRYPQLRKLLEKHGKLGICPTDGSFEDARLGNWTWWLVHRDIAFHLTDSPYSE